LVVLLDKRLLLVGIGLEEEAADLMKGAAQALQQFAHAAWGAPSTEGLLDPVARWGGGVEASYLPDQLVFGRQPRRIRILRPIA
jgi:hypothetical protein